MLASRRAVAQPLLRWSQRRFKSSAIGATAQVLPGGAGVQLHLNSGDDVVLHPLWLRERTRAGDMVHAQSRQRLFEVSQLSGTQSARIERASVEGEKLRVVYGDGRDDQFQLPFLLEEVEDRMRMSTAVPSSAQGEGESEVEVPVQLGLPAPCAWGSQGTFTLDQVTHDATAFAGEGSDEAMLAFLTSLLTYGAAVVKNTPPQLEEYEALLRRIGQVRATNWGKWFEVVANTQTSKQNSEEQSMADAAYTNLGIPLHTDGPYNANPLQFQLLQVLKQSAVGGESSLGDGLAAALALRERDADAFRVLTETPVRFRYYDAHNDLLTERPIINLNRDGSVGDIFFSERVDAAPHCTTLAGEEAYFEAKRMFAEELYRPRNYIDFKLSDGDLLLFDNRRVLHGRTAFSTDSAPPAQDVNGTDGSPQGSPARNLNGVTTLAGVPVSSVARYLRGCYVENVDSRFRVLQRRAVSQPQRRSMSSFSALDELTSEDVAVMNAEYSSATTGQKLAARALSLLEMLGRADAAPSMHIPDASLGAQVDLMEHGLQTATRCERDGCTEDVIVAGLLHDIGELAGPSNHGEFAAALLRPFVDPKVTWMLEHHEVFQMKYYAHLAEPRGNPDAREAYRNDEDPFVREAFQFTSDWCEKYDQSSFDPDYKSLPLEHFRPMVERVFSRKPYWHSPDHPKRGAVTG